MQSGDELWVVSASGGLCPGVELTGTGHSAGTGQIFAGVLSTLPLPCLCRGGGSTPNMECGLFGRRAYAPVVRC